MLRYVKFVLPYAPEQAVSCNGGMVRTAASIMTACSSTYSYSSMCSLGQPLLLFNLVVRRTAELTPYSAP
jgi:hypothetical protein